MGISQKQIEQFSILRYHFVYNDEAFALKVKKVSFAINNPYAKKGNFRGFLDLIH